MILDIQDLTIEVSQNENKHVLCKDLSFSFGAGETIGILGESGSGKSLTALSILNLLPHSISVAKGKIEFTRKDGSSIDLTRATNKDLQNVRGKEISMVFQEPMTSLNPSFTCGDQVLETIRKHQAISRGEAKEQVINLFNKVKLPDPNRIFNSYPHQLSGGQKQRVMIAIAISCHPSILIADEPTTALDVTVQKSILELLKELQAEMGMSILFITHDISVIAEIAHRLLIFYKGEIVEQGLVKEILERPQHPYTKGLLGCRTSVYTKGQRLRTIDETSSISNEPRISSYLEQPDKIGNLSLLNIKEMNLSFFRSGSFFGTKEKKQILHHISFNVLQGETLGLVGESGSGKTTIGRAIMKLIESDSGDIEFRGEKVNSIKGKALKEFRKNVQIIFQDPYSSLNPKLTVGEIIKEPLEVHNLLKSSERKKRVLELLEQVGLKREHYQRYPHQFSGGQKQRIGIARALAVEPQLIILDESVSALDVSIQAQILNLLNDLKRTYNLTYIFISHDLNTVRYMSDRVIVLKEGVIIEQGTSDELFESPKDPYTINLISSIPGKAI
jgi:peptide/nickel transport system ATP-binding protein